jgi:predicted O-methyltransferase YrrM
MKTFDQLWEFTDKIPGSFTRLSGEKLYEFASYVPAGGYIAEIGVDQGRSASLLLAASENTGAHVYLIDSWESILIDNCWKVKRLKEKYKVDGMVMRWFSDEAAGEFEDGSLDMTHIDANHHAPHPDDDCRLWMPKLKPGGVASFHDYSEAKTFTAVKAAVDKYCAGWEDLGEWDSLAIRRKPGR